MTVPDDASPAPAPGAPAAVDHLDVPACERLFRRNGLPLLVEGHSLDRDVFGRSAPFLLVVRPDFPARRVARPRLHRRRAAT